MVVVIICFILFRINDRIHSSIAQEYNSEKALFDNT